MHLYHGTEDEEIRRRSDLDILHRAYDRIHVIAIMTHQRATVDLLQRDIPSHAHVYRVFANALLVYLSFVQIYCFPIFLPSLFLIILSLYVLLLREVVS